MTPESLCDPARCFNIARRRQAEWGRLWLRAISTSAAGKLCPCASGSHAGELAASSARTIGSGKGRGRPASGRRSWRTGPEGDPQCLADPRLVPASIDLIWLSHIIEHIHEPSEFFEEVIKLLSPNGLVCILTPNIKSASSLLTKCHDRYVTPPVHLTFWSHASLTRLMTQHGLKCQKIFSRFGALELKEIMAYLLTLQFTRDPPATASGTLFIEGKGKSARQLYRALLW